MARTARKKPATPMIVFSRARDIPFNRIRLSDANVREVDVEAGLDELTQDIARREDLVQGLNVRAVLDADGNETGDFETPAGGRRYRSIARLVKAGRFPEDGLVPCIVKKADAPTSAVDDSLAENVFRLALHPLDQFKAFKRMVDGGVTTAEVAAAYFTTQRYVEQRLVLAKVSPVLHEVYAQGGMTLSMLEAFTTHPDHARQEQVWEALQHSYDREPGHIRKLLTETTVPVTDKRTRFVGIGAYLTAGGSMLPRYLFDDNAEDGGLEDVPLLDRLVTEKLQLAAETASAEGWKWVAVALDLPYGHHHGLREITGSFPELSKKEHRQREKLRAEYELLVEEYADYEDLPEEVDRKFGELEKRLEAFERPAIYDPADIAIAGVFITVGMDGALIVDRGWVRPEDEPVETVEGDTPEAGADGAADGAVAPGSERPDITVNGQPIEPEEDEGTIKPLSEKLLMELTAHRTVALWEAVGANPHVALTALLHRLVRDTFHRSTAGSALHASVHTVYFREQGIDLKTSPYAIAVEARHQGLKEDLPKDDNALWDWLEALDEASRMALLAHCVAYGIDALYERPNIHGTGLSEHTLSIRMAEAERLARAAGLDMVDAGFRPTIANYFGRVSKARIVEAVREGRGEDKARLITHMKKDEMAEEAERLLAPTDWLPEPLRRIGDEQPVEPDASESDDGESGALPEFLAGDDEEGTAEIEVEADESVGIAAE